MPQFIRGSPDLRYSGASELADSLGMGIGNALNTYFANRSLESVLQDKSLQNAPLSVKMGKLHSALSRHGEPGQKLLQAQLAIAQQANQERETQKAEILQKKKGQALGKYLDGKELTDEERTLFTPSEWVAMHRAKNPKMPAGQQPVPPDQLQKIEQILKENPNANPNELGLLMGKSGVNPTYSNSYVENARTEEERKNERFSDEREYHSKISRPIIESAQKTLQESSIEKGIEQQLRRDIASGNTSGLFPFMIDKLHLDNWRNPESARFSNSVKNLFVGSLNEIPGARPNQFIERFLSTAQPLIGSSPEANLSVLDVSDFVRDVKDEHARLELDFAKKDRQKLGYAKDDISERAWDAMGDYVNRRQERMALDIRERHEEKMQTADLLSEVLNGKVPPDTPLTPKMMKIFYIKNNKNVDAAIKEAKENNFVLPQYLE